MRVHNTGPEPHVPHPQGSTHVCLKGKSVQHELLCNSFSTPELGDRERFWGSEDRDFGDDDEQLELILVLRTVPQKVRE